MKLDFNFDSTEFSKLTDDSGKAGKAAIELSHAMNMVQASTDLDLNFKIAAVKKVRDYVTLYRITKLTTFLKFFITRPLL